MAINAKKTSNGVSKTTARATNPAPAASIVTAQRSSTVSSKSAAISRQDLEQRIRDRAYFIYLNRGACSSGCAKQDWIEAERQIKKELSLN